jgi:hypothetical protein
MFGGKLKKRIMTRLELKDALKAHLSTLIDFEGAGYPSDIQNTLKNVANSLYDEVLRGNPNELRKGLPKAFESAIQGLPSYINQPFEYWEISNLVYALGWEFNRDDDDEFYAACNLYTTLLGEILADEYNSKKELA